MHGQEVKNMPRVRLELTTFRSLLAIFIMRLTRCRLRYRGIYDVWSGV